MKNNKANLKVAIIYVNYNTLNDLRASMLSLSEDMDFYEISFIVIDNNSEEKNFDELQKECEISTTIIPLKNNVGFAAANNIGFQYAKEKDYHYCLFLNCDTLLTHNMIKKLVSTAEEVEKPGIVSCRIVYNFDKQSICYDGGSINHYKGSADIYNYMLNYNNIGLNSDGLIQCSFASGCCMLIATNLDVKMSEDYFLYYEDTDFSIQILKKGYKIYVNRDAILYHTESVSTKKKSNLYTYYFVRNRFLFIKNNICGYKKIICYGYSFFWVIKKIVTNVFNLKYAVIALYDFLMKKKGKKLWIKCEEQSK